jgi:hypothetical protein
MKRLVVALVLVAGGDAVARPASSGWFAEGGLGAVGFLPKVSTDARVGPALDLRFGRDLFSWLSIGVGIEASSHEARVPPPPEGEWFQLYRFGGDARIGGQFDTIAVFVEGGVGLAMISSNILSTVMVTTPGQRFSIAFQGGAGAEYQLENRHYAIGLALDGFIVPQFSTMTALAGRAYLRYTY